MHIFKIFVISSQMFIVPLFYFQDICKYMKGELTEDMAHNAIRSMIAYGIERVELRDEMYCQLLRQTNGCRHVEYTIRAWLIMALCATSFNPSRTLLKVSGHVWNIEDGEVCSMIWGGGHGPQ